MESRLHLRSRTGRPRGLGRAAARRALWVALGAVGLIAWSVPGSAATATSAPTPAPLPSAIGSDSPSWIQVAPNYQRTGLVVVVATQAGTCTGSGCVHLWVSHDGGATWRRAKAAGFDGGRPVIAVDARGHDILFSGSGSAMLRSDDGGDSWVTVGPSGTPAVSPNFANDNTVAVGVSGGTDYLLDGKGQNSVSGSGGSLFDMSFMYAPSFPNAGTFPPVLLTAEDKSSRLPVIQQCSASFVCHGSTTLAGAVVYSSPVTLLPSTAYASDGTVFAQSGRGIYKSSNGGTAFAAIPLGDPSATAVATPMMALAPGYKEAGPVRTAWVSVFEVFQNKSDPKSSHTGGGVFRTDDGGTTWHSVGSPSPFDQGASSVAVGSDGRLFGGYLGMNGQTGLLCSTDGGNSWQAYCPKEGDAANDPGVAAGAKPVVCTTCSTPRAGATSVAQGNAAAPGASTTASPAAGSGGAAGTAGLSEAGVKDPRQASSSLTWLRYAGGGVLALVLALAAVRAIRSRRSRDVVDS